MTGRGKDEKGARGFEGLGDLLSDEQETPSRPDSSGRATRSPQADQPPPIPEEPPPLPRSARGPAAADNSRGTAAPLPVDPPSQKSVPWGWIAAGAVVVLIVLANMDDQSSAPQSAPTTTTGLFDDVLTPSDRPGGVDSPPGTPVTRAETAVDWNENRPPVGQDRVLTRDQIRYCVAESVRIETMEKIVNEYDESDVDTFNGYVDDYNSRCGSFRYREGALESVQREVDAVRSALEQEGRTRLRSTPRASNLVAPQLDPTVDAMQVPLNTRASDADPEEGLDGTQTHDATAGSQVDNGTRDDGARSRDLMDQLAATTEPAEPSSGQLLSESSASDPESEATIQPPLSADERRSLESACNYDKVMNGPAAYNRCVDRQLSALHSAPRGIDLSGLSAAERRSLESACNYDKLMNGPAAYNRCIERQITALQSTYRGTDLSDLSATERRSLESACNYDKLMNGPAAYNQCLQRQVNALKSAPRGADLSGLSSVERASLESACNYDKLMNGPAAYNRCVERQLSALQSAPRGFDLSALTPQDRRAVDSACNYDKLMNGPAAYRRCVAQQMTALNAANQ